MSSTGDARSARGIVRYDISSPSPTHAATLSAHVEHVRVTSIPLLRFCDGGLRLRAFMLESHRARQGDVDSRSWDRCHGHLPGGRAVLPNLLHIRRHPDRGLWLRP